jgi:hypothetical protein
MIQLHKLYNKTIIMNYCPNVLTLKTQTVAVRSLQREIHQAPFLLLYEQSRLNLLNFMTVILVNECQNVLTLKTQVAAAKRPRPLPPLGEG